ncbi:MAG: hypothetical protein ACR2H9_16730 [Longimicrobiaceae bacterium]|nr:SDR family NAD(P)-dependent oxidoreductase [Gemmatimonadota bacterium]
MNQTIVITGCSSGFGYDLALTLARRGDRVYATMRAPGSRNAEAARALRDLAEAESLDLRELDPLRRRLPRQQVGARGIHAGTPRRARLFGSGRRDR